MSCAMNMCCACVVQTDDAGDEKPQGSLQRKSQLSVNDKQFSMMCVSMDTFLGFESLPSYAALQKRGLLLEPGIESQVHLVSHEWLSHTHPDPSGVQLRCLQEVFRRILGGHGRNLFTDEDWVSFSQGYTASWTRQTSDMESSAQLDKFDDDSFAHAVEEGVVWMDFLSIPQVCDVLDEETDALAEVELDQASAVQSIPYYVERSNFFWVVTPEAVHEDRQVR